MRARMFGATQWKKSIITGNRNNSSYDHRVGANDIVDTNKMPRPSAFPAAFLFISIFFIRSHGLAAGLFGRSFSVTTQPVGRQAGSGNSGIRRRLNLIYADKTKNLRMSFILCRTVNEDVLFPNACATAAVLLLGVMDERVMTSRKKRVEQR